VFVSILARYWHDSVETLREAVIHLSGYRERNIYGATYSVKWNITMADLLFRADYVIRNGNDVINYRLQRNGVNVLETKANFVNKHTAHFVFSMAGGSATPLPTVL